MRKGPPVPENRWMTGDAVRTQFCMRALGCACDSPLLAGAQKPKANYINLTHVAVIIILNDINSRPKHSNCFYGFAFL